MCDNLLGQCEIPHVLYILHIVEGDPLQIDFGNLKDVLLVFLTHHDVGNTGTLGSQDLFLDTTNFYIYRKLAPFTNVKVSIIARGISVGDELEYTDEVTLGRSILNRTPFEGK